MQETKEGLSAMKPGKKSFDESKLTPGQKAAVAIAKAQGKDLTLTLSDLEGNMDPDAVQEIMDVIMDLRKRPAKPRAF